MKQEPCAHELCKCDVEGKRFCSHYCEEQATESVPVSSIEECLCGHPACSGEED
jgi:hypothetical protein